MVARVEFPPFVLSHMNSDSHHPCDIFNPYLSLEARQHNMCIVGWSISGTSYSFSLGHSRVHFLFTCLCLHSSETFLLYLLLCRPVRSFFHPPIVMPLAHIILCLRESRPVRSLPHSIVPWRRNEMISYLFHSLGDYERE